MRALLLLLVACGPTGSFRVDNKSYSADEISAERMRPKEMPTVGVTDGLEGVVVTLLNDPIASAVDDEVGLQVSLFWASDQRPELNQEVSVGKELAVRALPRMSCFCGTSNNPVEAPDVKGKLKLTSFSDQRVSGDFELTFIGQMPHISGGVLFEDVTVKASVAGFVAQ